MKPERFCSGCCSPICSWTSSCSGGNLARYVSGKARRRMAKALRGAAGWFDPVKEERKKGHGRAKGKTGRKETPAVVKTQEKELPPVKTEMKPTEKTAEKNSEKRWKNSLKRTALSSQEATGHANSRQ